MRARIGKQEAIEEITRRLVEFYRPVRIYLFGSEARGDADPDSDLDFLVVVPDDLTPEAVVRALTEYATFSGIVTASEPPASAPVGRSSAIPPAVTGDVHKGLSADEVGRVLGTPLSSSTLSAAMPSAILAVAFLRRRHWMLITAAKMAPTTRTAISRPMKVSSGR